MSIRVVHRNPEGHLIEVPGHILDLDARIKAGAPEHDWNGDPRAYLVFNPILSRYEVWRHCEDNQNRILLPLESPIEPAWVLKKLGEIDSWSRKNGDAIARMEEHNRNLEFHHRQLRAEMDAEAREILQFAAGRSHLPGWHDIKGSYGVGSINRKRP